MEHGSPDATLMFKAASSCADVTKEFKMTVAEK
jgi:hypothetical protein